MKLETKLMISQVNAWGFIILSIILSGTSLLGITSFVYLLLSFASIILLLFQHKKLRSIIRELNKYDRVENLYHKIMIQTVMNYKRPKKKRCKK